MLYKYCNLNRMHSILFKGIRFTQPKYLNDPFEISPVVEKIFAKESYLKEVLYNDYESNKDELIEIGKKAIKTDFPLIDEHILNSFSHLSYYRALPIFMDYLISDLSSKDSVERIFSQVQRRFNTEYGILCLSEVPNDIRMWSLYSDSHNGAVIEFDTNHPFFDQRTSLKEQLKVIKKVEYTNERPRLTMIDPNNMTEEYFDYIRRSILYTKSLEWEYEKEWRIVLPLDLATNREEHEVFLFKVPPECIVGIIFGSNVNQDNQNAICKTISEKAEYQHIKFFKASRDKESYSLKIIEI